MESLTDIEVLVYAEIANATNEGVCNTPTTVMRRKCGLSTHFYNKTLTALVEKQFISQETICAGVPRILRLLKT